ncbi:threonine-phosphate decarboxylase CobD [Paenibacillus chungangensis]|uniref:threonine-phosphate decarboxylase n=1 Tax=Paenibacillus chungangensis TaxID=696535 RepID=A0ABW3HPY2_9BACL
MLERFGHGGDLTTAAEAFGRESAQFLDFSSNMNPLGPPEYVGDIVQQYIQRIQVYPDPASRKLKELLSNLHGIDEKCLLIGNGAAELIDLAVRAIAPEAAAVVSPCFSEYADAVGKLGSRLHRIPLSAQSGFVLGQDQLWQAMQSGAGLYILGSPNNPTGRLIDRKLIEQLLDSGAYVMLDEAFLDFVPGSETLTMVAEAARHSRLIVIRSMTKFYAVPGIRLGYAAAAPELIDSMRSLQVPWSVNSLAQSIGEAVIEDMPFVSRTLAWLDEERTWLAKKLNKLGFIVTPSDANYLLLRLPERMKLNASSLQEAMGRTGVLIRDASLFPGLDERYIRVAVKLREQNASLLERLAEMMAEGKDGELA